MLSIQNALFPEGIRSISVSNITEDVFHFYKLEKITTYIDNMNWDEQAFGFHQLERATDPKWISEKNAILMRIHVLQNYGGDHNEFKSLKLFGCPRFIATHTDPGGA